MSQDSTTVRSPAKPPAKPKRRLYGWLPDHPDHRDHVYSAPAHVILPLPTSVDLRHGCPSVYDQLDLGSCTAQAICAAIEFVQAKEAASTPRASTPHAHVRVFVPSRLFVYWNERVIEHSVASDSGAQLRTGIKVVASIGAPPESEWPYLINRFKTRPSPRCFTDARKDLVTSYQRVPQSLQQMKSCLASGYPFVFGFSVYESFESDQVAATGIVPMPTTDEGFLGGHAVMAVGYDDSKQRFIVRNSWGASWGQQGYFEMPYEYLTNPNLADDMWTVRVVTERA